MKLYIKSASDGIKIPACPKKAYNNKYQSKTFYMNSPADPRDKIQVEVLRSSASARAFIVSLLRDQFFPMARDEIQIADYLVDYEWYKEDMREFVNSGAWLYGSEGDQLAFLSNGNWWIFDGSDDAYESAILALKHSKNIDCLIYESSYGCVVYNAYVVWEPYGNDIEDGMWRVGDSANDYISDPDAFEWKNVNGTQFQIPDWANSFKDIVE